MYVLCEYIDMCIVISGTTAWKIMQRYTEKSNRYIEKNTINTLIIQQKTEKGREWNKHKGQTKANNKMVDLGAPG